MLAGSPQTGCGVRVELRFEILLIQREVQYFRVARRALGRGDRAGATTARTDQCPTDQTQTQCAGVAEKLSALQTPFYPVVKCIDKLC
ncbi:hypothetical protein KBK24_0134200 [Burkholderia sp. K24]|nr:hypothetical protein KBK24_0134200 [Burkholderia sp. K24]